MTTETKNETTGLQLCNGWLKGQRLVFGHRSTASDTRFEECVFAFLPGDGEVHFDRCTFVDCQIETRQGLQKWHEYCRQSGRGKSGVSFVIEVPHLE